MMVPTSVLNAGAAFLLHFASHSVRRSNMDCAAQGRCLTMMVSSVSSKEVTKKGCEMCPASCCSIVTDSCADEWLSWFGSVQPHHPGPTEEQQEKQGAGARSRRNKEQG